MTLDPSPSQTVGPFFAFGLPFDGGGDVVPPGTPGAISLHGTVRDGAGAPVPDALLEFWQVGPDGRVPVRSGSLARDGRSFTGFARVPTDRAGDYALRTLRPAPVAGSTEAPHLAVTVFARGLLHHLFTRVYFPNHPEVNAADPLLSALPEERAATLLAVPDGWFGGPGYRFDVRLQGPGETVFLDLIGGDAVQRSSTGIGGDAAQRSSTGIGGDAAQRSSTGIGGDAAQRSSTGIGGDAAQRSSTGIGDGS